MAKLDWDLYDGAKIRLQAEIDQLRAKMIDTMMENGTDWVIALDELLRQEALTAASPRDDIARFAAVGILSLIKEIEEWASEDEDLSIGS